MPGMIDESGMSAPPDAAADPSDPAGAGSDDGMSDEGPQDSVVATIMYAADGTFKLVTGDEPEDGSEADGGKTFNSIGELLKGVLDEVKTFQANIGGDGDDQQNFQQGYSDGSAASPPKQAMGGGV